jgi:uncharacterized protein with NRDE domain
MCTYILYHDPGSEQPLVLASVRNERLERKTLLPSQADWKDPNTYKVGVAGSRGRLRFNFVEENNGALDYSRYTTAGICAPQDRDSNSTFAGINKYGVVSTINNLDIPINFSKDKLNRGGLVLDALTFRNAKAAAETIYELLTKTPVVDGRKNVALATSYPSFSLIIADKDNAYIIQNASAEVEPVIHSNLQRQARNLQGKGSERVVVSLERIPPRTAVISCGWGVNDDRSGRSQRFLPVFQHMFANPATMPRPGDLSSWGAFIGCMMEQIAHGGDVHDRSITQPPYERVSPDGRERKWCATLSTALFMIHKQGGKAVADMYFSPSPPNAERPMGFQALSSDPKRFETQADRNRLAWDKTHTPHTNYQLTLDCEEVPAPDKRAHYRINAHQRPMQKPPERFIPGEQELNDMLAEEARLAQERAKQKAKTDTFRLDATRPATTLQPGEVNPGKPEKKQGRGGGGSTGS